MPAALSRPSLRPPRSRQRSGAGRHDRDRYPGVSRELLCPERRHLVIAGDGEIDALFDAVADTFGEWEASPTRPPSIDTPGSRRRRSCPNAGSPSCPRAGAAQSELRIGHVCAARDTPDYHALVAAQHDPRRAVRQPREHEPAPGQGLHLRCAHRLRSAPRSRSVRAADERWHRGHGAGDSRSDQGDRRHPRRAAGHRRRARTGACVGHAAATRAGSRPRSRWRAA